MSDAKKKPLRPSPMASGPNQKLLIVIGGFVVMLILAIVGGMFSGPDAPAEQVAAAADDPQDARGDDPKTARPAIFDEPTQTGAPQQGSGASGADAGDQLGAAPGTVVPPMVGGESGRAYETVGQGDAAGAQAGADGAAPPQGMTADGEDPRAGRRSRYDAARNSSLTGGAGDGASEEAMGGAVSDESAAQSAGVRDADAQETPAESEEEIVQRMVQAAGRASAAGSTGGTVAGSRERTGQRAMGTAYRPRYVSPPPSAQPHRPRVLRPGEAGTPEAVLAGRDSAAVSPRKE